MKTRQIFKIFWYGFNVSCTYYYNTVNPYRLYAYKPGIDKYGYHMKHKKQIAAYADLSSVLYHLYQLSLENRIETVK